MYQHRVYLEAKWSKSTQLYLAIRNTTKTGNTILYTTNIAIHSIMHCQTQMRINCTTLTIITALLIATLTIYSSLYHSYFDVANAESVTHPSLIIKPQNKLCQLQNRAIFAHDFTVPNYSNQHMNALRTQCHTHSLPCARAMPKEYEIKNEIYSLILSIANTPKISSLNRIWDFLAELFVCYCPYILSMSEAIKLMKSRCYVMEF